MEKDFLWMQIKELPYFRALLRAVEAKFYQNIEMNAPVLDLGCGDGNFGLDVFDFQIDAGIDPWKGPLHEAAKNGRYKLNLQSEGAAIPFASASFETVFSNSVLEHIPDVDAVIPEVSRVLRPGGKFIFCVPNHQFLGNLSVSNFFDRIHLHPLANAYRAFFNKISRHHHCDDQLTWGRRLEQNGFRLVKSWHYFSPGAFHTLEWGHYFGLPSLISHFFTRKWVLCPYKWNLWLTEKICRPYYEEPAEQAQGSYTFYIAEKK